MRPLAPLRSVLTLEGRCALGVAVLLLAALPARAQVTALASPPGGEVRALVRAAGAIYAGTARGGVFRSTDGGLKWAAFRDGIDGIGVNALTFGPDGALYAAGGRFLDGRDLEGTTALYRLAPGAATWTDVTGDLAGIAGLAARSALALPDGALLAGTTNGVYRSADGGATWATIQSGRFKPFWTMLRAADGTLYAGSATPDKVLRSDDGGQTWVVAGTGLPNGDYRALAEAADGAIVAAPFNFFYTTDRGASWQQATLPSASGAGGFFRDADGTLHASGGGGHVRSTDHGRSWSYNGHNAAGVYLHPGPIARAEDGRALVGTRYGGVIRSDAAFYLWQGSSAGLAAAHVYDLAAGPDGRLYASTPADVYGSADAGQTWEALGAGGLLHFSVAATADAVYAGVLNSTVIRLRNDGTRDVFRLQNAAGDVSALLALPSGRLVAARGDDVFVSDNAGATWTLTRDASSYARALARGADGRLWLAHDDGLFRSPDDGATWTFVTSEFGVGQRIYPGEVAAGGGRVYASTGNAVFRSPDDGATWAYTFLPSRAGTVQALHVAPDGALWVGARGGLFRSEDGGVTFENRSAGLYDPSVTDLLPLDGGGTFTGGAGTAALRAASDGLLVATEGGGLYAAGGTTPAEPGPGGAVLGLGAYPNPASGRVTIALGLRAPTTGRVEVLDVLGRRVAVVHDGPLAAGDAALPFDASALAPGLYLVRLVTPEGQRTRPLSVTR